MTRAANIHQARVYLAQARVRRHQHGFHAVLMTWVATCRRQAATPTTNQLELF
jgi:hypothetical protein